MNKLKLLSLFLFTTLIAGLLVACVPASATTSTPAITDTPIIVTVTATTRLAGILCDLDSLIGLAVGLSV